MSERWFIAQDSKTKQGPFSLDALQELAQSGKLRPSDLIWKEGTSQWVAASSIEGLFDNPINVQPALANVVSNSDALPIAEVYEPVVSEPSPNALDIAPHRQSTQGRNKDESVEQKRSTYRGITSGQGWIIISMLSMALLATWGVPFCGLTGPQSHPPSAWEYKVISPSDRMLESELKQLGDEGWELVFARRATSEFGPAQYEMIFKRKKG